MWISDTGLTKTNRYGHIRNVNSGTGDILLTKYDEPSVYFAKNGFNIKPNITKNITSSIQWYSHGHYTHCAVVVVLNNQPYVYHLTDDICFDHATGMYKIGSPTLVPIREMVGYHGLLYHFKRRNNTPISDNRVRQMIDLFNQRIQGNAVTTILSNGLKIINRDDCEYDCKYVCTDFARDVLNYLGISNDIPKQPDLSDIITHCNMTCDDPVLIRTVWYDHTFDV